MDKDVSAKQAAYSILRKYKIDAPTLDEIVFICFLFMACAFKRKIKLSFI